MGSVSAIKKVTKQWGKPLQLRWEAWEKDVLRPLRFLYGERDDFDQWVARFLQTVGCFYEERSAELHVLDQRRLLDPAWYQASEQVGYVAYTDRFANKLNKVSSKVSYLQELGVTYLHLMPLLQTRPAPNDGGYAVVDYRQIDKKLGTMADLENLTAKLRKAGISLCIDLVCNHTATEHEWAQKALAGDERYQDYYLMFPDRTLPDEYDKTLREIFPEFHRGNFVHYPEIDKWVWTTFNLYQWDLNYKNPAVFGEMLANVLFLANKGVEILRMDAVAFMWKELGTTSENLPQAHALLQAWRALSKLAAPATVLLAEAIVSPEAVVPYFGQGDATNKECELAYHNSFMVYLWSALAERKVNLMTYGLQQLPPIPDRCAWLNYVRVHDDIGWAITDYNASGVGLDGFAHRSFLSDFYSGEFPDSFARGLVFQFNPENMDRRINGSCASLAGLEKAAERNDEQGIELAIGRILLIHSMILAYGGIPIIYMGDELGLINDYKYIDNPEHRHDSRWVHRPKMPWQQAKNRHDASTIEGRIFQSLQHMIAVRKKLHPLHAQAGASAVWMHNERVFGLLRHSPRGRILVLGNFSEEQQIVSAYRLYELGFGRNLIDHLTGNDIHGHYDLPLAPFQAMWLEVNDA